MYTLLARILYFGLQHFRGEPIREALENVRRTEFISLDELLSIQAKRQLAQLRFALESVPYYRRTYAPFAEEIRRALDWEDVNRLMERLPIIEKGTVTGNGREFTAENAATLKTFADKTSGSSGTPVVFPCDQVSWAYRHALAFRATEAFGVKIGEPYILYFGLHWNRKTRRQVRRRDWILNRVRISAYEIAVQNVDCHLKAILAHHPTHLQGYPSAIYDFCILLHARGLDLKKLKLKAIFLTSEPVRDYQRAMIEKVTGSRCVDLYGSAEGGFNSFECPAGSLHIAAEATWVQVREPGASAGEAIVTDMMLRAFPLIRYAIGDEIVLKPGKCSCGRPHPMLQSIEGRSGDPILLPNGRRINPNMPSYIFKPLTSLGVLRRYRFVHESDGTLKLFLVVTEGFGEEHLKTVERETHSAFGEDVPVSIRVVDALPHLPNAKHRDYVRSS